MKQLGFILSLFIFMLVIAPCSDVATCDSKVNSEVSHSHDHSEDHDDTCTPFCTCQCCGVTITFSDFKNHQSSFNVLSSAIISGYTTNYSYQYLESVWHPPSFS